MKIAHCSNWSLRDNGTSKRSVVALVDVMQQAGYKVKENIRRMSRPLRPEDDPTWADFNIWVDDGRDDIDWLPPRPNAAWMIDSHLGYPKRLFWAKQFDNVFCAQKASVAQMEEDGIKNVHWLPLACHPQADLSMSEVMCHPQRKQLMGNRPLDKLYDTTFVGFLNTASGPGFHNRVDYLAALFGAFPNSWFAFQRFFEEASVRYHRARLGFNISIKNDLNMRFFEGISYGTALLTNDDAEGWKDLGFEDGKHFIGYDARDFSDMISKAQYYLNHPQEREEIAEAGHKLVREKHTYHHRMKELLEVCGIVLPPQPITELVPSLVIVKESPIHGVGGFATKDIPKSTQIIEYIGERISYDEAARRYKYDTPNRSNTYLFNINTTTVIDASVNGNEAKFINHSCEPNSEAYIVDSKVFIRSIRDIRKGEELTYDYNLEPLLKSIYPCRCGASSCRGTLLCT